MQSLIRKACLVAIAGIVLGSTDDAGAVINSARTSGMACVPSSTSGYATTNIGINWFGPYNYGTSGTRTLECEYPIPRADASLREACFFGYNRHASLNLMFFPCVYENDGLVIDCFDSGVGVSPGFADEICWDPTPDLVFFQGTSFASVEVVIPPKTAQGQVSHVTSYYLETQT
jgi:hypothetical protein